jgi:hypothetical protein
VDARSLAMSRLIAEKMRRDPDLFDIARETMEHWKRIQRPWPRWLNEWDQILREHSPAKVLAILTQETEEGNRLRQSDPFCGILTEEERLCFLNEYEAERV